MFADLRLAVKGLTAAPRYTLTAVVTLALGIGANTLIGMVALRAQAQGAKRPPDLGDAAIARDVSARVRELGAVGAFSGIVAAARGTTPIVVATAGYADRAAKTPFTPSTRFTIGSIGKMFTAAAVGQLVDAGRMSFDDVVGRYLPDYPNATVRNKVTVGMLLSHTSGMGDFLARRTPSMMETGVARADEFLPLYARDEPAFEPGTRWSYSNAGLALAGAIVERVSGEAYPDYLRAHVFRPAGMTNSAPNNVPRSDLHLVVPYTKMTERGPADAWRAAPRDIGSPAGGAISTAEDLVRFADALRGGRLVTSATFRAMVRQHGAPPRGGGYGYCMEIAVESGRTIVGHGGGFPGVSTHLYLVLDSPYTVVALANIDPPAAEQAAALARSLLIGKASR
jgi:CubicO group peptidase (beta-lactamase class C family)